MPESLEEIATCALYEPTAQREAVLARVALDHEARLATLESAGGRGEGWGNLGATWQERAEALRRRNNQLDLELGAVRTKLEGERDALQQQLAALEVEWNHVQEAQIPDLHRALAESRAALAKYGTHTPSWHPHACPAGSPGPFGSNACTCGLADALAATTPTAGGS